MPRRSARIAKKVRDKELGNVTNITTGPPRHSARIAKKVKVKESDNVIEVVEVIDLTIIPSPQKSRQREGAPKDKTGNTKPATSPNDIGRQLDEAADELFGLQEQISEYFKSSASGASVETDEGGENNIEFSPKNSHKDESEDSGSPSGTPNFDGTKTSSSCHISDEEAIHAEDESGSTDDRSSGDEISITKQGSWSSAKDKDGRGDAKSSDDEISITGRGSWGRDSEQRSSEEAHGDGNSSVTSCRLGGASVDTEEGDESESEFSHKSSHKGEREDSGAPSATPKSNDTKTSVSFRISDEGAIHPQDEDGSGNDISSDDEISITEPGTWPCGEDEDVINDDIRDDDEISSTERDSWSSHPGWANKREQFSQGTKTANNGSGTQSTEPSKFPLGSLKGESAKSSTSFCEDAKENMPNFNNNDVCRAKKKESNPAAFFTPSTSTGNEPPNNLNRPKAKYTAEEQLKSANKVLHAQLSGNGSHYRVLGIPLDASSGMIKKAYHEKIRKLHPDKNKSAKATEAFRAAKAAYDVLRSPNQRAIYDRNNVSSDAESMPRTTTPDSSTTSSNKHYAPGSSHFNTILAGTRVTMLQPTSRLIGQKGTVLDSRPNTGECRVLMDNFSTVEIMPIDLLQNINVCPRPGTYLTHHSRVRLMSVDEQGLDESIWYKVSILCGRTTATSWVSHLDFVAPNGTIVRMEGLKKQKQYNGKYGQITAWVERFDEQLVDTSYYNVRISSKILLRVKMVNVRF